MKFDFWILLYIIDWTLFVLVAITVLYLGVFAIASLFNRHSAINKAKKLNRFAILIPSYMQDDVIEIDKDPFSFLISFCMHMLEFVFPAGFRYRIGKAPGVAG